MMTKCKICLLEKEKYQRKCNSCWKYVGSWLDKDGNIKPIKELKKDKIKNQFVGVPFYIPTKKNI